MNNEKKEVKKECRHYPLLDHYRTTFSWMRQWEGASYFVLLGAAVTVAVICPFLAMALLGAVVYLLDSGWEPGMILLALVGYVTLLQGLHTAKRYLEELCQKKEFFLRISLGSQLFEAVMDADFQFFESKTGHKKLTAARMNLYFGNDKGVEAFLKSLRGFLVNLLGLVLYSVIIGRQSVRFLPVLLLLTGVAAAVRMFSKKRAGKYDEKYEEVWGDSQYLGKEALVGANGKDIRLYHMWNWFSREFDKMTDEFVRWGVKWWWCAKGGAQVAERIVAAVRDLLVYGYLIAQMIQGNIELSAFLLYVGTVAGFGRWMMGVLDSLSAIGENSRHMDAYRDFLECAQESGAGENPVEGQGKTGGIRQRKSCGIRQGQPHEIRLEHVSFRYEGNGEDTIHDLSLTITPGEKIALVGMNGAGKSTLIKLICGLYRPSSGRIYLDGKDVSGLSPREYRREFSVVFQDVFAFSFPLADNVSCTVSPDRGKLEECLRKADLWERVQSMEKKEETYLNKDIDTSGVTLSGGEMQKLMLARALYKGAPVVILDEPTAALDPIAESRMYEKYDELTKGKTSIFISHRLSSTKFCSRILYLEGGRIAEEGGHEELLARQGAYAAMYHTQAQYYEN